MTLGLDYDDTYTLDPDFFDEVILVAKKHGHKVICVTQKCNTAENRQLCKSIPGVAFTEFTAGASKIWYMEKQGIKVDVWIEDNMRAAVLGR